MSSQQSTVLSISDLHFNPCYDVSIVEALEHAPVEEWESVFNTSEIKTFSSYGKDTNFPLLESFFTYVKTVKNVDFVMFSGDFLGHRLQENYIAASHDKSMKDFEAFATKTFQFLAMKFKEAFPAKAIYLTLGNDDSFDGDYKIEPAGSFLSMVQESWSEICALPDTFKAGGYYSTSIPELSNNKLIVLNNTFMSTRYSSNSTIDEGDIQINWLREQLKDAADKQIWVMFHEPLGINIYPTIKKDNFENPVDIEIFLKEEYYSKLLNELKDVDNIRILFSGHTHMDSYRLVHASDNTPHIYNHITPAVSPIFGNNPGFQVFTIDNQTNYACDYQTFFLDLKESDPQWKSEYVFSEYYDLTNITPETMFSLWIDLGKNMCDQGRYKELYSVSSNSISDDHWKAYFEAISEITPEEFARQF